VIWCEILFLCRLESKILFRYEL